MELYDEATYLAAIKEAQEATRKSLALNQRNTAAMESIAGSLESIERMLSNCSYNGDLTFTVRNGR